MVEGIKLKIDVQKLIETKRILAAPDRWCEKEKRRKRDGFLKYRDIK